MSPILISWKWQTTIGIKTRYLFVVYGVVQSRNQEALFFLKKTLMKQVNQYLSAFWMVENNLPGHHHGKFLV